jgi:hypothetical protein
MISYVVYISLKTHLPRPCPWHRHSRPLVLLHHMRHGRLPSFGMQEGCKPPKDIRCSTVATVHIGSHHACRRSGGGQPEITSGNRSGMPFPSLPFTTGGAIGDATAAGPAFSFASAPAISGFVPQDGSKFAVAGKLSHHITLTICSPYPPPPFHNVMLNVIYKAFHYFHTSSTHFISYMWNFSLPQSLEFNERVAGA